MVLGTGIDLVGADEAKHLAVPLHLLGGIGGHDHRVGGALDLRRPALEAHQFALTHLDITGVDQVFADRQLGQLCEAAQHLHLVAVWIADTHALAATRLVDILDAGGAGRLGELLELVFVFHEPRQADELRRTEVRDMDVMVRVGAAHVQRILGAVGTHHAEGRQELLGLIKAG